MFFGQTWQFFLQDHAWVTLIYSIVLFRPFWYRFCLMTDSCLMEPLDRRLWRATSSSFQAAIPSASFRLFGTEASAKSKRPACACACCRDGGCDVRGKRWWRRVREVVTNAVTKCCFWFAWFGWIATSKDTHIMLKEAFKYAQSLMMTCEFSTGHAFSTEFPAGGWSERRFFLFPNYTHLSMNFLKLHTFSFSFKDNMSHESRTLGFHRARANMSLELDLGSI